MMKALELLPYLNRAIAALAPRDTTPGISLDSMQREAVAILESMKAKIEADFRLIRARAYRDYRRDGLSITDIALAFERSEFSVSEDLKLLQNKPPEI